MAVDVSVKYRRKKGPQIGRRKARELLTRSEWERKREGHCSRAPEGDTIGKIHEERPRGEERRWHAVNACLQGKVDESRWRGQAIGKWFI
jgi:hypothetical protein